MHKKGKERKELGVGQEEEKLNEGRKKGMQEEMMRESKAQTKKDIERLLTDTDVQEKKVHQDGMCDGWKDRNKVQLG